MNKQNMSFCMFVFLILVVSFTGCESKPPASMVENTVFAYNSHNFNHNDPNLIKNHNVISEVVREKLKVEITNSFSREVEVRGLGKEKHRFIVSSIVWKSREIRDNYYRGLISDLQEELSEVENSVALKQIPKVIMGYEEIMASNDLDFITRVREDGNFSVYITFKQQFTFVKRGNEWHSLGNSKRIYDWYELFDPVTLYGIQ